MLKVSAFVDFQRPCAAVIKGDNLVRVPVRGFHVPLLWNRLEKCQRIGMRLRILLGDPAAYICTVPVKLAQLRFRVKDAEVRGRVRPGPR